jgi:[ribosomal protein S5]-alanine N-acetyltransferase
MFPNTFQTQRVLLRPIAPTDAGPIFEGYAKDPQVSRYVTWRPHVTIEDTETYIRACTTATSARTYVLLRRSDGQVIGTFDLRQPSPSRLGFGYVLTRPSWGAGIMTEVLTHIVDWALRQPGIWRIGDVCDVENPASARVMEKAGLHREGVLRRWGVFPNLGNEPRDCISYAKFR